MIINVSLLSHARNRGQFSGSKWTNISGSAALVFSNTQCRGVGGQLWSQTGGKVIKMVVVDWVVFFTMFEYVLH